MKKVVCIKPAKSYSQLGPHTEGIIPFLKKDIDFLSEIAYIY